MAVNRSLQGVRILDEDGNAIPTIVLDGSTEFAVRDEELLNVLTMVLTELRAVRMMLGHATEIGFAQEHDD